MTPSPASNLDVTLRTFQPADQAAVKDLVLAGLGEHWGTIDGRMILQELVCRARQAGFRRVVLETTETWQEVIAFYLRFGFTITHYQSGDVYFALDLGLDTASKAYSTSTAG